MPAGFFGPERAASGIALITASGGAAGFVAPIVAGNATEWFGSLASGLVLYGVLTLLAGLALVLAFKNRQIANAIEGGAL
jgi:hypothetical protein